MTSDCRLSAVMADRYEGSYGNAIVEQLRPPETVWRVQRSLAAPVRSRDAARADGDRHTRHVPLAADDHHFHATKACELDVVRGAAGAERLRCVSIRSRNRTTVFPDRRRARPELDVAYAVKLGATLPRVRTVRTRKGLTRTDAHPATAFFQ